MSAEHSQPSNVNGGDPREQALLAKIKLLEDDRIKFIEIVRGKIHKLEKELEAKTADNEKLNARNVDLESNLKDLGLLSPKGKKATKAEDDDLLTRARELLFEKTKICKKQEQQLEALNHQVDATKDVLEITKDMLNLRNIESDHQQSRIDSMILKLKLERDRRVLLEKKLEARKQVEDALRKEYDIQSGIFKDLRCSYEGKIVLLTKQLAAAKEP